MSHDQRQSPEVEPVESGAERGAPIQAPSPGTGGPQLNAVDGPYALEVHIEELVLDGFAPADRHAIGEAVERELERLLAVQGLPSSLARGSAIALLDGGAIEIPPGSTGKTIGERVARAIDGGLRK